MVINGRLQSIPFPLPFELGNGLLMDEEIHYAWNRATERASILVGDQLSENPNNWSKDFENVALSQFLIELENIHILYLIVKNNVSSTNSWEQEPISTKKYNNDSSYVVMSQHQEKQLVSLMFPSNDDINVSNNLYHSNMPGGINKLSSSGTVGKRDQHQEQSMTISMAMTTPVASSAFVSSLPSQQASVSDTLDTHFNRRSSATKNIHAPPTTGSIVAAAIGSNDSREKKATTIIQPSIIFYNENDPLVQGRQAATAAAKNLKTVNIRGRRNLSVISGGEPNEDIFCPTCKRTFSRWRDYERHRKRTRTHSGEKLKCLFCNKSYARPDNLKRHQDTACKEYQKALLNKQ